MFFICFTFKKNIKHKHKTTMFGSILKNTDVRKYKILDLIYYRLNF